jgi:PPOX class probable F420-dependent enzyme
MPAQTPDRSVHEILRGRHIASLATQNADGTIHLTAVWYLFENGNLLVATSSKTRKARNLAARPKASLMVDIRKPGAERGVTATGIAELLTGQQSLEINGRIHSRYLSCSNVRSPN